MSTLRELKNTLKGLGIHGNAKKDELERRLRIYNDAYDHGAQIPHEAATWMGKSTLKSIARKRGLTVGGNRETLIQRLNGGDQSAPQSGSSAPSNGFKFKLKRPNKRWTSSETPQPHYAQLPETYVTPLPTYAQLPDATPIPQKPQQKKKKNCYTIDDVAEVLRAKHSDRDCYTAHMFHTAIDSLAPPKGKRRIIFEREEPSKEQEWHEAPIVGQNKSRFEMLSLSSLLGKPRPGTSRPQRKKVIAKANRNKFMTVYDDEHDREVMVFITKDGNVRMDIDAVRDEHKHLAKRLRGNKPVDLEDVMEDDNEDPDSNDDVSNDESDGDFDAEKDNDELSDDFEMSDDGDDTE